jgi:hypothetical protein
MNVYTGDSYIPAGCGCCNGESIECVVVADTKAEALGLLLERFTHTDAEHWTVEWIDDTKKGVVY